MDTSPAEYWEERPPSPRSSSMEYDPTEESNMSLPSLDPNSSSSAISISHRLPPVPALPSPAPTAHTTSINASVSPTTTTHPRNIPHVNTSRHGTLGGHGPISPPTPAPSPGPPRKWSSGGFDSHTSGSGSLGGDRMDIDQPMSPGSQPSQQNNNNNVFLPGPGSTNNSNNNNDLDHDQIQLMNRFSIPSTTWNPPNIQNTPESLLEGFKSLSSTSRFAFLSALVEELRLNEALVVSRRIEPRLRRDFLVELPAELALYCLSFVEDAKTLARASQVSRHWYTLLQDDSTWKQLCERNRFTPSATPIARSTPAFTLENNRWRDREKVEIDLPNGTIETGYISSSTSGSGGVIGMGGRNGLDRRRSSAGNNSGIGLGSLNGSNGKKGASASGKERGGSGGGGVIGQGEGISFKQQFKSAYLTQSNWLQGGRLLASHVAEDDVVVTSFALDEKYIVMGMANRIIHVFSTSSGRYIRSLLGHEQGVWAMVLITPSPRRSSSHLDDPPSSSSTGRNGSTTGGSDYMGRRASFNGTGDNLNSWNTFPSPSSSTSGFGVNTRPNTALGVPGTSKSQKPRLVKYHKQSDPCGSARGWGVKRRLLLSAGCDRSIRLWDLESGDCIHILEGHLSTVRCLKVFDNRPIAVSGCRDGNLKVWNLQKGELVHNLVGHTHSVRCLEIAGNLIVSGSYDNTARVWDVDTGECIHVLRGHYHQIYTCAFDGVRIITGSLDSTVRVWDAATGNCIALLQGHTSLVGQLQLLGNRLVTGGSDGRVIIYDLDTFSCIHRICAHDNSVTTLQMDERWIVSGGNDGRVCLFSAQTGAFIRDLVPPGDAIWRMAFKDDRVFVMLARGGRTVLEMLTFRPGEEGVAPLRRVQKT